MNSSMSPAEIAPDAGDGFGPVDKVILLASLATTEAAGLATDDGSKSRYILLGIAALGFVKAAASLIRAERAEPEEPLPWILDGYDPYGQR